MLLISKLPTHIKKGLIAAKFTYKHPVTINTINCSENVTEKEIDEGRSYVDSYYLKTA